MTKFAHRIAFALTLFLAFASQVQAQLIPDLTLQQPAMASSVSSAGSLANYSAASPQLEALASHAVPTMLPSALPAQSASQSSMIVVNPAPHGRMFGSQLFGGTFRGTLNPGFNPDYQIAEGDNVHVRLWGMVNFDASLTVDTQGNIFIPNVGPIEVAGVSNAELDKTVEHGVRRIYKASTSVYASLDASQPVKVYVTGYVRQPGLYSGVASDSPIAYLDKAGGVDPDRGSYIDILIKRGGQVRQHIDLYSFLIDGTLQTVQFHDGDVIIVEPRKHVFSVNGDVFNSNDFEFSDSTIPLKRALEMAKMKPGTTNVSVIRQQGKERRTEYYSISDIDKVVLNDGDQVNVTTDRAPGTIQVRIDGAHSGVHAMILPYGSKLQDVLDRIKPNSMSEMDAIQIFRLSVAARQKEMLNLSLQKLQQVVLTAQSDVHQEVPIRQSEANLVSQYINVAKKIQPKGQVILDEQRRGNTLLEDGDTIYIPERTSLVMVHGEVLFPNAVSWERGKTIEDYINQAGGYSQSADTSKAILIRQNGATVVASGDEEVNPGDEIMVLPHVGTHNIEIGGALMMMFYQIAFAAKVAGF